MAPSPLFLYFYLYCDMDGFTTEEIKLILTHTQTHSDVFKLCALCAYTGGRPTSFKNLPYSAFAPVDNTDLVYAQIPFRKKKYIVFVPAKLITLFKKLSEENLSIISYDPTLQASAFPRLYRTLFGYVLSKNNVHFGRRNAFRSIRKHFINALNEADLNEDDKNALLGYTCIEPTNENITRLAGAYQKTKLYKLAVF